MAKGKGNYGGAVPGNMNSLIKQAQKMQREMEEAQKSLEDETASASAGGGAVEVTVSGKKEIISVKIGPEAVDPEDVEMLEDLIMAAVNEALRKMDAIAEERMAKVTGGIGGTGGLF